MNIPVLYIFDPEDPSEDFIELTYEVQDSEYVIEDYPFLAAAATENNLSVSSRISFSDLKYFVGIKEGGKQKVAFSGSKSSADSGDPIIIYTANEGESYQFAIKI